MEFIERVARGRAGLNVGISGGLPKIDKTIGNIQLGKIYSYFAQSGAGKSYMLIYRHILSPWLAGERNIKWFFWSLEMDTSDIIGRMISFFLFKKHGIRVSNQEIFSMGEYRLDAATEAKIVEIYETDITPILERMTIITDSKLSNPTGIYKHVWNYASEHGSFVEEQLTIKQETDRKDINGKTIIEKKVVTRTVGYTPDDPDEKIVIMIDHLHILPKERGYSLKQNIDKWMDDYAITIKRIMKYTIVNLCQVNRTLTSVDRMKFNSKQLQPQASDIKETSSIEQSSDMLIALFDPNALPHLDTHQGFDLADWKGHYRSLHIVKNRNGRAPLNQALLFDAKSSSFTEMPLLTETTKIEAMKKAFNLIVANNP